MQEAAEAVPVALAGAEQAERLEPRAARQVEQPAERLEPRAGRQVEQSAERVGQREQQREELQAPVLGPLGAAPVLQALRGLVPQPAVPVGRALVVVVAVGSSMLQVHLHRRIVGSIPIGVTVGPLLLSVRQHLRGPILIPLNIREYLRAQ